MNDEDDSFRIENLKIKGRPLMVGDLKEQFFNLNRAYEYYHSCDKDVQDILGPVLSVASDTVCNMCYELGFDDPCEVDGTPYYIYRLDL